MSSAPSRVRAGTTPSPAAAPDQVPTHKWLITLAIMLGATLEVLDTSIINVSLPHMQGSFSAGVDEVSWILTSYLVANGIMIPLTGWISSRLGRKRYFLMSVIAFMIMSGFCGAARSLNAMIVFRLMQGAAGAAMIPSSQAILMETFPPEEQALAMAVWGLGMLSAPMLGPTLGGWITDNWNWRWNFYINMPIGAVAVFLVYIFVHDPDYMRKARSTARRVDYMGVAYLVVGLGLLQIVLDRGQRADWFAAPWVCAFTAIAVAALILLVVHEVRFPEPILDLSVLKIVQFDVAVVLIMVMSLLLFGLNLLNPLFFQKLLGYTAWKSGLAVVPRGFGTMTAMIFVGQLARYGVDTRKWVGLGFVLLTWSLWSMAHWSAQINMSNVLVPMTLSGVASGFIFPTVTAASLSGIEHERMGYAASLANMMRNTGSAIGISLVTNMLNTRLQVHQSYLVNHFTIFDAWRYDSNAPNGMPGRLNPGLIHGLNSNHLQGFGMIYGIIQHEAALLAYNDIYRMLSMGALLFIPSFLMLKKRAGGAPAAAH